MTENDKDLHPLEWSRITRNQARMLYEMMIEGTEPQVCEFLCIPMRTDTDCADGPTEPSARDCAAFLRALADAMGGA